MSTLKTPDAVIPAPQSEATSRGPYPKVLLAGLLYVLIGALNATIIFDDGYLLESYRLLSAQHSLGQTLKILFFILDLNGQEYRLYGVSKILHFMLWHLGGAHAWFYGAFMAAAQFASGLGIFKLLTRLRADRSQSAAIAAIWLFSPFAVTSCFHHYSYLLLPCQLTVACALVLQQLDQAGVSIWKWRSLLAFMGFLLVTTGDSHLPVSAVVFVLVACLTPADRLWRNRITDLALVFSVMAAFLVIHRWGWTVLSVHTPHVRYVFAVPSRLAFIQLNKVFFHSLPTAITSQIRPLFALAGPWIIVTALAVVLCALLISRSNWAPPEGSGLALVAALAVILVASLFTVWALSISTKQVSAVLPRRYGYVPNTIAAMLVVSLLSAPAFRRWFGRVPALAGVGFVVWLWLTLVVICLPIVRAQDAKVWAATSAAIRQRGNASVLFANSWNNFAQPTFVLGVGTPGLRGLDFPDIFESPFSYYWWESQYPVSVLGAHFAAYRFEDRGASVLLEGNGLNNTPPIVVPKQSVVVITDNALEPSIFPKTRHRISVLSWPEFESSLSAHRGAVVTKEWSAFFKPLGPDEVQISLGNAVAQTMGTLPDKAYTAPVTVPSGPVANYGLESGGGGLYSIWLNGPLTYFLSNRNGSYTYRVDFTDQAPKTVALNLWDLWHETPGARLMQVDAAFDDQWFHVDKRFDPAAFNANAPLSIQLFPGAARTFRVRIASAPGATDVPFINGIRVAHEPH